MVCKYTPPSRVNRSGALLVECALILPVIFVFFAGMIEISRVLLLQHTADTAAYEGARDAMVPGATSEDARNSAQELLRAAGLRRTTVTVMPEDINEETSLITVMVEVPLTSNYWITPFWFTRAKLTSEVTLFCERPPQVTLTGVPKLKLKKTRPNDEAD